MKRLYFKSLLLMIFVTSLFLINIHECKSKDKKECDCNDIVTKTDAGNVTKYIFITSNPGQRGIGLRFMKIAVGTILDCLVSGASECILESNEAKIEFRNGEILILENDQETNCENNFLHFILYDKIYIKENLALC